MKKLSIIILVLAFIVALGTAAMASTIGVNVTPGYSLSLDKYDLSNDPYVITGNFGIINNLLVKVGYQPSITNQGIKTDSTTYLGARYELRDNLAATFDYNSSVAWQAGIRTKMQTSKQLALVGVANYNWTAFNNYYDLTGNAEYAFNKIFTGNVGLNYTGLKGAKPRTNLMVGTDFTFGKTELYFDTTSPTDNILKKGHTTYALGMQFGF